MTSRLTRSASTGSAVATEEEVAAELIAQRKDLGLYGFNIPVGSKR